MTGSSESIWRERATEAELARVAEMDRELERLARERRAIAVERLLVTNRACQRSRYHRRKNNSADSSLSC